MSNTKSKHTPGPWTIGDFLQTGNMDIRSPDKEVCLLRYRKSKTNDEVYANAALIAAAPDLLSALEEFIACGPNAGHNSELIGMVKQAIAKAKGGE